MITEVILDADRSFIGAWLLPDPSICDDIIRFHQNNPNQVPGRVNYHGNTVVDAAVKKSTDCYLGYHDIVAGKYVDQLQLCVQEYIKKFPECDTHAPWKIVEQITVKKYNPDDAYYFWHCERGSAQSRIAARHLVFMTYLNDVTDGGETEFLYQGIKIKPQRGLTLIWPVDWTHTHRGLPSPTETKYITSGWFAYTE